MIPTSGENSQPSESTPQSEDTPKETVDGREVVSLEQWQAEMTEEDHKELQIQIRMYEEGARAVREEVAWLEEHNFPIWIYYEGEVVDARTLPDEVRAKDKARTFDLSRPKLILRPKATETEP